MGATNFYDQDQDQIVWFSEPDGTPLNRRSPLSRAIRTTRINFYPRINGTSTKAVMENQERNPDSQVDCCVDDAGCASLPYPFSTS